MTDQPHGGTHIDGDANVEGGDFVAGDKVVQNIQNVLDIEKLIAALKQVLPADDRTPEYLLETLQRFQNFHASLHEWKELHNFLNDVLMMSGGFNSEVERIEIAGETPNSRLLGRLWHPISQKVDALLDWGKSIQHIDQPFRQSEQELNGPAWAIDLYVAKARLDELLKSANVNSGELVDARSEFADQSEKHMYLADKKLRETAEELYTLSRVVLGSMKRE